MNRFGKSDVAVTNLIDQAFSQYYPPKDIQKEMQEYIDAGDDDEMRDIYLALIGRHWKNVHAAVYARSEPAMLMVSANVFQWYFPGYMSAALSEFSTFEYVDDLTKHIVITSSKYGPQKLGVSLNALNERQLDALVAFLQYIRGAAYEGSPRIQARIDRGIAQVRLALTQRRDEAANDV